MRVVVTGARGRLGKITVGAPSRAGYSVVATDLEGAGVLQYARAGESRYIQADLSDAGQAFAVIGGADAVVHIAATPNPFLNPAHVLFANNLMITFNCLEASVHMGVRKFVNLSSEATLGFQLADCPFRPDYLPVDEEHPMKPQDAYSLAKTAAELLVGAAVQRSSLRAISLRSSWLQFEGNIEANVGELVRNKAAQSNNFHSYTDPYDLADAITLALEADLEGHEVMFTAAPDNVGGWDFVNLVSETYHLDVPIRPLQRRDASGISSAKAEKMLGWRPKRSWRDYLDSNGRLLTAHHRSGGGPEKGGAG